MTTVALDFSINSTVDKVADLSDQSSLSKTLVLYFSTAIRSVSCFAIRSIRE